MFSKTQKEILSILEKLSKSDYDFSWFISPAWYTVIKSFFDLHQMDIGNVSFSNSNVTSFLKILWFFDENDYSIVESKQKKILPIRTINSQDWTDIEIITNEFSNLLIEFLWRDYENLIAPMTKMIWELLNNISDHSGERDLYDETWEVIISANYQSWQFYSKKNFIQIAIIDTWVWFLNSVKKKAPEILTARDAIEKALEARFTWGTTLDPNNRNFSWITNRWIWLTTTLEILKKLEGDLFIGTRECLYGYNGKTKETIFEDMPLVWKWSIVIFNIYTDKNIGLDFMEIEEKLLGTSEINSDIENSIDFW